MIVSGLSGAGKSTALRALEDQGFEVVDNLPLSLVTHLLETAAAAPSLYSRPIAVGIDARTRRFNASDVVKKIRNLNEEGFPTRLLFLDCSGSELIRRFSETRRRHPLALDRPAADGIAQEREVLAPLRRAADVVIDTTDYSVHDLRRSITQKFSNGEPRKLTVTVMSFGFARGVPRDADLMFDMRFLSNPHWDEELRPLTGHDAEVGAFIRADPRFEGAVDRIADLISYLLPAYHDEGKSYLTIAIGCTGGRHRSVYTAERLADHLREAGIDPAVMHRDISESADSGDVSR
ncbi:RNase adaptor protein RapZ [Pacificimonas flava]|uniref:RNase adaptor protein RapZ n=2 Tax=Pacificimonas TaxID=1960290 RepID=A0A219BA58_9SPHN|nr:RNase adapter RapZ [Pacificimonas aurantium]OWV34668.1 RNase adaptor protein RapZ [Pacificimonas flava]